MTALTPDGTANHGRKGPIASGVRISFFRFGEGGPWDLKASSDFGPLRRDGACWVNERAKACAWK